MNATSCLFLKPPVIEAEDRNQKLNIDTFIKPAIEQAGLTVLDGKSDGVRVDDISDELVEKVYEADIVVIDANCYEKSNTTLFTFSPYLYYFMALKHRQGNCTILVADTANAKQYLPDRLRGSHTLFYSLAEIWSFINRFKAVVEEIRQGQPLHKSDNPIQGYLVQKEFELTRREFAAKEAELEKLRAQKQSSDQPSPSITFRRVP